MKFDLQNPVHVGIAAGVVLLVGAYVAKKLGDAVVGGVTGDNAITRNQTDAAGNRTDAYVGKGIPGTLGAVANTASGGVFATIGEYVGRWTFDIFGPKVDINAPIYNIDSVKGQ